MNKYKIIQGICHFFQLFYSSSSKNSSHVYIIAYHTNKRIFHQIWFLYSWWITFLHFQVTNVHDMIYGKHILRQPTNTHSSIFASGMFAFVTTGRHSFLTWCILRYYFLKIFVSIENNKNCIFLYPQWSLVLL